MKVSVIVPFEGYYNYLADCLESIQDQNIDDIETLLITDQSGKQINELIDLYQEKIHIKLITCMHDSNTAVKRNLGLENAMGDYVYFLDSDDYIMPQTLSLLLQEAENKDLDLVLGKRWITWFKKQVFETMGYEKK